MPPGQLDAAEPNDEVPRGSGGARRGRLGTSPLAPTDLRAAPSSGGGDSVQLLGAPQLWDSRPTCPTHLVMELAP